MAPHPRSLPRALVLLICTLLLGSGAAVLSTPALARTTSAAAHPHSDPIYWPLRVASTMDCFRSNPGCRMPHKDYMLDVVPVGQGRRSGHMSHAGVYAMGAGVLHIGDAHGIGCGKINSYGTWVWIDHGAGVLSRYGHLSRIVGHEGERVAAGQQIGAVGTTGKKVNCHIAYVNFSTQRNGLKTSHGYDFGRLLACSASSGRTESWPRAFSRHRGWNALQQGSVIPASSGDCIDSAVPTTAAREAKPVVKAGKGKLAVRWKRPATASHVDAVMVEVGEYHPSRHHWDLPRNQRWIKLSGTRTSVTVHGLVKKHKHRVRVWFHNAAGWSKATAWVKKTTKK